MVGLTRKSRKNKTKATKKKSAAPAKKKSAKKVAGKKKSAKKKAARKGSTKKLDSIIAELPNPVARAVKKLRGDESQRDFAVRVGLKHGPAIGRMEMQEYKRTTIESLMKIAVATDHELVIRFKPKK